MTETETGVYQVAFEQVQRLLNARDFDLALEQVDAILEVHRLDARSSYLRAVILRHLGRHKEAIELLQTLVKATRGV